MGKRGHSAIGSWVAALVLCHAAVGWGITLSGRVYEGNVGDENKPLPGVTVTLYGSNNSGQQGTHITSTTTNSDGWYGLEAEGAYDYFNIVQTNLPGYASEGASTVGGSVINDDWIQYDYLGLSGTTTGNRFWDKKEGPEPPENHPPVAVDDAASTSEDTAVDIHVLNNDSDPDGDPLHVNSATDPPHGTTVNHGSYVTYTPDPGFTGTDTFNYTAGDGKGGTDTATVRVTVQEHGEPPQGTGTLDGYKRDAETGAGLENWRIFIDLNGNGLWDSGEPSDLTDSTGYYRIGDVEPGTYRTCEEMRAGWEPTSGASCVEGITIVAGVITTQDFHNRRTQGPDTHVDVFGLCLVLDLDIPGLGRTQVSVGGPATEHIHIGSSGLASDTNGNGRDDVATELIALSLTGMSPILGQVNVGLATGKASVGQIEERANNTPGILDVPPYTIAGTADSFFDVYFEIVLPDIGKTFYCGQPATLAGVVTHVPPATSDAYTGTSPGSIPLLDGSGLPAGSLGPITPCGASGGRYDYGDAPSPYPVTQAQNGARHSPGGPWLGLVPPDTEQDGWQSAPGAADGDDSHGTDDEDGAGFWWGNTIVAGRMAYLAPVFSGAGEDLTYAVWIDYNGNGNWEHPAELFASGSVPSLPSSPLGLTIANLIPASAVPGRTCMRCRVYAGVDVPVSPTGAAQGGEVEDSQIEIRGEGDVQPPGHVLTGIKFDDLDGDGVWEPGNGEQRMPNWVIWLDADQDGQPDQTTTTDPNGGFVFAPVAPGIYTLGEQQQPGWTQTCPGGAGTLTTTVPNTALPTIHFMTFGNRRADGAGSVTIVKRAVPADDTQFDFAIQQPGGFFDLLVVKLADPSGSTWSIGDLEHLQKVVELVPVGWTLTDIAITGDTDNGSSVDLATATVHVDYDEGENIVITFKNEKTDLGGCDFGDAQDPTYPTRLASNGARHRINPTMYLGSSIDAEMDGQPTSTADGDNTHGANDEDGVTLPSIITGGQSIPVKVMASSAGALNAWIDLNVDGDWKDPGEHFIAAQPVVPGMNTFTLTVPANAQAGQSFARFRFSSERDIGCDGEAPDGEVEDYAVILAKPGRGSLTIIKDANPADNTPFCITVTWQWMGGASIYRDPLDNSSTQPQAPTGVYGIGEFVPAGWTLKEIVVTGDTDNGSVIDLNNHSASVDLDDGESITVVFKNEKRDEELDFGDAPVSYGNAWHTADDNLTMGGTIDAENGPFNSAAADGDDNNGIDDENGLTIISPLIRSTQATVSVEVFNRSTNDVARYVAGWIDFDGNGQFHPVAEHIGTVNIFVPAHGAASGQFVFTVPQNAKPGNAVARFRLFGDVVPSNVAFAALPTGDGGKGEVEDYQVCIISDSPGPDDDLDFGDAPDSYKTLKASGGACHTAGPLALGSPPDIEPDGVPSVDALGDDNANLDDEDGIANLAELNLIAGQPAVIHVSVANHDTVQNNVTVAGWIDFNGDHQFDPIMEGIGSQFVFLGAGGSFVLPFPFAVPLGAQTGTTYARFRLYRTDPNPMAIPCVIVPTGEGGPGEVEDYVVQIQAGTSPDDRDYGDAPHDGITTFYPSANHQVGGPWWGDLGDLPDVESGMQRNSTATGDDTDTLGDDENGLFGASLVPGQNGGLYTCFVPGGSGQVTLGAWVDFNGDGDWDDAGERSGPWLLDLGPIPTGGWPNPINVTLPFAVPAQAQAGQTFARLRIEKGLLGFISDTGPAGAGEVEDHIVEIKASDTPAPGAGMIWGIKFQDLNGNGIWEAGTEPLLPGWTIWLDSNQNGTRDAGDTFTQTNGMGVFTFTGLASGTYLVGEEQQAGWVQTWPAAPGTHSVMIQANTLPWGVLFGNLNVNATATQLDWGDAPDPTYPTLRSSNGAYHVIAPGFQLGSAIDTELDGQPSPDAMGDDHFGVDDDDGVFLLTPILPGQMAGLEILASAAGFVDAWIDLDVDGTWQQATDQILKAEPVAAGSNVMSVAIPATAAVNVPTYARFRFSSAGYLPPDGPAQDGEVEDYYVFLGEDGPYVPGEGDLPHLKWSQPPVEIDPNVDAPPVFCGWDEPARSTQQSGSRRQWRMDADDFHCLGPVPITRIRWWGGYKAWARPEPPESQPIAWHIGFWANQVSNLTPDQLYLERLVWSIEVPAERVLCEPVGLDEFPGSIPEMSFVCELRLVPEEWFHQAELPTNEGVFWISITAIYPPDAAAVNQWGWKTRPHVWRDGATMPAIMGGWPTDEDRLFPGRLYPVERSALCGQNQPFDLCFELLTEPPWITWDQPFAGIRDWPHCMDLESQGTSVQDQETIGRLVADDWTCERNTPVIAIAWWGSYIGYGYEACQCEPRLDLPRPDYFLLRIWSDAPALPGEVLWEYRAFDYDEVLVGYDRNPEGEPNEPVFRYSVRLPEVNWFRQDTPGTTYWLSVAAVYTDPLPQIVYPWGWTNHPIVSEMGAAFIDYRARAKPEWRPVRDPVDRPVDMSFTLFTLPEEQ
ncbi:MAG: cadherin-like domain-containing protein [Sedimentisphaerales bacterium]|nr:cadherin-like domain-containing protein [Sedimentisphaerales bacterium]